MKMKPESSHEQRKGRPARRPHITPMINDHTSTAIENDKRHFPYLSLLQDRGISSDVAAAYGLSVYDGPELIRLRDQYEIYRYRGLPLYPTTGLLTPYPTFAEYSDGRAPWNGSGATYHRVRSDETSIEIEESEGAGSNGRKRIEIPRYFATRGSVEPYFTWSVFGCGADTSIPLLVCESPLKAISIEANIGMPAIGLGGVLAGAHDKDALEGLGEVILHPMLRELNWNGRTVYIAFDAGLGGGDNPGNPLVALGAARTWKALSDTGANVRLIRLPYFHPQDSDIDRGILWQKEDQGPDDYIAREGAQAFKELMARAGSADPVKMVEAAMEGLSASERPGRIAGLCRDTYFQAAMSAGGAPTISAVSSLTKTRAGLGKRDLKQLIADFNERIVRRLTEHEPTWKAELVRASQGAVRPIGQNAELALRHDPTLVGLVGYDEFSHHVVFKKPPPWAEYYRATKETKVFSLWQSEDTTRLGHHLGRAHGIVDVPEKKLEAALVVAAREHAVHPVRDYLRGLKWDGNDRLKSWLTDYLGVELNDYSSKVGKWWLVSGAARILKPGCKADCILVLEGPQGLRKSSALSILGGEWFSDADLGDLQSKEAALNLQGKWIFELPEGEIFSRASAERLKAFTSKTQDDLVPKYSNHPQRFLRQVIMALTTNDNEYLTDSTGNRRFWPIKCTKIDLEELGRDRDQLWAEAVVLFDMDERWWPTPEEEQALCAPETRARLVVDPWLQSIIAHLIGKQSATVNSVLEHVGVAPDHRSRAHSLRVTRCLRMLGWGEEKRSSHERLWFPGPEAVVPEGVGVDEEVDDQDMDDV